MSFLISFLDVHVIPSALPLQWQYQHYYAHGEGIFIQKNPVIERAAPTVHIGTVVLTLKNAHTHTQVLQAYM